jgi:hypothetical protein
MFLQVHFYWSAQLVQFKCAGIISQRPIVNRAISSWSPRQMTSPIPPTGRRWRDSSTPVTRPEPMVCRRLIHSFFVSFDYSSDALQEIESFFKRSHKVIVALTVQEILDEHIAKKLV